MARKKATKEKDNVLTGERFDAMTDEQRASVLAEIEAETPEQRRARSKPLNAEERAWWRRVQKKAKSTAGRPKFGKGGTRIVSITVEKELLKQADRYARSHGLKRSELVSLSIAEKIGTTG
jgi:hypothetical protein